MPKDEREIKVNKAKQKEGDKKDKDKPKEQTEKVVSRSKATPGRV